LIKLAKFFKVTEEIYGDQVLDDVVGKLDNKSAEAIASMLDKEKDAILTCIMNCESPIEMMLALAMKDALVKDSGRSLGADVIDIENQHEIVIGEFRCRADFVIPVYFSKYGFGKHYVIECDGHEFHERTKEQVTKDNQRRRGLTRAGYVVINFSGSEVYKDAYGCAREIKNIIVEQTKELIKQHEG